MSATELVNLYFFGTPPIDPQNNRMSDETLQFYISSAQKEVENYLNVKTVRQAIRENRDYFYDDWIQWNYIPCSYQVVKPISLKGYANTSLQLEYAQNMLVSKKQAPDEDMYHRSISLVPASGSVSSIVTGPLGIAPYVGYFGNRLVPNYWEVTYITGFNKVPFDIMNAVGYLASIPIFIILGDLIAGAGIASKSIGIDGLSQSISTTASATNSGYGARVLEYRKTLKDLLPALKARYVGITFGVM